MIIGIDASFLRKPGTGIGVVTEQTLRALSRMPDSARHRFILYLEEYADTAMFSGNFEKHIFLPKWTRDDVPRKILWERMLSSKASEDGCDAFVSLSQSATVFPKKSGIRHIMIVHDIVPILFPTYRGTLMNQIHSNLITGAIAAADRIFAVSETTKRDLVLNLGIDEAHIAVAYPDCAPLFRKSLSLQEATYLNSEYGLTTGYIYHGGGLEVRKNTERLLRAYAMLRSDRTDIPTLVISGRVHDRHNRLATDVSGIIEKLGLGECVKLLGFVPEENLPALYRGALFFAFPSLYEGFGLPIVEAFAVGTPVLAGQTAGSVPEITGGAALLVETKDIAAIAVGLERLIDDASFRETLVERGKERIKAFSWDSFAETLYTEIVSDYVLLKEDAAKHISITS